MKAYSRDLREHILQAVAAGHSKSEVARFFGVGRTTVKRYARRQRETGSLAPKPIPGRSALIGPNQQPLLHAQLAAHPDATLAEHCQYWAETVGVPLSPSTMARAIKRLGWTRKKRRWWPPNETRWSGLRGGRE